MYVHTVRLLRNRDLLRFTSICRLNTSKPNVDNIVRSVVQNFDIPNLTIPEFIFQNFSNWPNKVAIECGVTGKKFTFEEVRRKSRNLSFSLLKKLMLRKQDVVAVLLPNVPEYPISVLGVLEAGLILTTLNPLSTIDEITKHLLETETKAVITLTSLVTKVHRCCLGIPIVAIKENGQDVTTEGICFNELINICRYNDPISLAKTLDDVAMLPFSTGTTGYPKAVALTHRNIVSNLCQTLHPHFRYFADTTDEHQDVIPAVLPFFHMYGMVSILFAGLWNMFTFLTNSSIVKKEHFETVRRLFSSAAPFGSLDEEKFIEKAEKPIDIVQAYGLTEASPSAIRVPPNKKRELACYGSVGETIPNTLIKVISTTTLSNAALGPNQPGEILIKGPQVMKGYHNKPDETKKVLTNGWLKTGDIGYYDENNMFYITDRLKDVIKVKGFQVAPAELEEIIRYHPNVDDVGVIGIPDTRFGKVPRAYIVLKQNTKVNLKEIQEHVAGRIADYKQIRGGVVVVGHIPKSASGKMLRKELKKLYEREQI